jgi:phi13 family phage major tail protein
MAITIEKPAYIVTVRNAYFADRTVSGNTVTYGTTKGVSSIKQVGISKQKTEQKIHASGLVYDLSSQKAGANLSVQAVQLPLDLIRKYEGETVEGGFSFESSDDQSPEFAFGYYSEYSDGNLLMYWYPRCKMTQADYTDETSTDSPHDPARDYVIVALPTDDKVICVTYDQSKVPTGKIPYTAEEFFTQVIDSPTHAKVGAEPTAST